MERSNQNKKHVLKEKFMTARDLIMDHNKIVMPLVLVVCVLITIFAAVNANHREALEIEAQQAAVAAADEASVSVEGLGTPAFELEENAHPEINNVINTYYEAQASGDVETISSLNAYLDEIETIRVQELSKYIEAYPIVNVYTKPGMSENTYVAYVYSEVQFIDVAQLLPGMQTYYIGQDENGNYFINDGTYDDNIWNYIREITLQDDVVDLNNKVVVEYNELLAEDEELSEFVAYLKEKINEDVGEILAEVEQEAAAAEPASANETVPDEEQTVVKTVRATDVVNIRRSDSEEADKIDKAQVGQEFTLLEEKGNGWSRVEYNGGEAYIKSDYLEAVLEETIAADASGADAAENTPAAGNPAGTSVNDTVSGTVKVVTSVKIRKSASTDAEILGTAYAGQVLDLIMKQADGWTRIKYNGQTAYVKSDYVE